MLSPYQMPTICSVCGGEGAATVGDAASEWLGAELAHVDPNACRMFLDERRAEMDREAAK